MSFWSDVKLREKLQDVIFPVDENKVDVSGYRLSVGDQIFVTKDIEKNGDPAPVSLSSEIYMEIPAGQFALISTKEKVTVPKNAIGFISMRAKTKFKGLINVSGFHVDPGYSDHLIFSVFNAGPKAIPIKKGDDIFLIWFADLDQDNSRLKHGGELNGSIPSDFINNLNMQVDSAAGLSKKVNRIHNILDNWKWSIPILSIFGPLTIWAAYTVYSLDIKANVFESDFNRSSATLSDMEKKIQLLESKLIKQEEQIVLIKYDSDLDLQRQAIDSMSKRILEVEKRFPSKK